jgi:hypothetical protein
MDAIVSRHSATELKSIAYFLGKPRERRVPKQRN